MIDPFDRSDHWRNRARHLRSLARVTHDSRVAAELIAMACAFERHARTMAQVGVARFAALRGGGAPEAPADQSELLAVEADPA